MSKPIRAARLAIKVQDEIDPQLRIATPEGDYWLAATLPADVYGRKVILRNLSLFLAWKRLAQIRQIKIKVVDTFRPGLGLTFLLSATVTGTRGLRFIW